MALGLRVGASSNASQHSPTCTNKRINRTIVALHQCLYLPRSSNSYFPPHISRDSPGKTGPLVMRTTKGLLNNEIKLNISNKSANCWGEFRIFLVDTCTEARTLNLRIQMSGLGFQYARLLPELTTHQTEPNLAPNRSSLSATSPPV